MDRMQTSIDDIYLTAEKLCGDNEEKIAFIAHALESLVRQLRSPEAIEPLLRTIEPAALRQHPSLALALVQYATPLAKNSPDLVEEIALLCLLGVHTDSAFKVQDDRLWAAWIAQLDSLPLLTAQALMKCLEAHKEQRELGSGAEDALKSAKQALQARGQRQVSRLQEPQDVHSLNRYFTPSEQPTNPLQNLFGTLGGIADLLEGAVRAFEEQPLRLFDEAYANTLRTLNRASFLIPQAECQRIQFCMACAIRAMLMSDSGRSESSELLRLQRQVPASWWQTAWQMAIDQTVKL
jgi:hypothetical protein